MLLCRVQGNVVATRKHPSLEGWRLAVCQPVGSTGAPEGSPQVAIDPLGADTGEYVMISSDGLATRRLVGDDRSPARWIVIGIVDAIHASHDRTMGRSDNRTADRTDRRVP